MRNFSAICPAVRRPFLPIEANLTFCKSWDWILANFSHDIFIVPLYTIRSQSGPLTLIDVCPQAILPIGVTLFTSGMLCVINIPSRTLFCSKLNREHAGESFISLRCIVFEIYLQMLSWKIGYFAKIWPLTSQNCIKYYRKIIGCLCSRKCRSIPSLADYGPTNKFTKCLQPHWRKLRMCFACAFEAYFEALGTLVDPYPK